MLKLGIDLDGVLADFDRAFIQTINAEYPDKKIPIDFQNHDWGYTGILNSSEEMSKVWDAVKATSRFWQNLAPYHDNVDALYNFLDRRRDASVYYITSRVETIGSPIVVQTRRWLEAYGLDWANTNIIVVAHTHDAQGRSSKLQVAYALGLGLVIDDYLPTAVSLGSKGVLLDRPWNREGRPRGMSVVPNLEAFLAFAEIGNPLTYAPATIEHDPDWHETGGEA